MFQRLLSIYMHIHILWCFISCIIAYRNHFIICDPAWSCITRIARVYRSGSLEMISLVYIVLEFGMSADSSYWSNWLDVLEWLALSQVDICGFPDVWHPVITSFWCIPLEMDHLIDVCWTLGVCHEYRLQLTMVSHSGKSVTVWHMSATVTQMWIIRLCNAQASEV